MLSKKKKGKGGKERKKDPKEGDRLTKGGKNSSTRPGSQNVVSKPLGGGPNPEGKEDNQRARRVKRSPTRPWEGRSEIVEKGVRVVANSRNGTAMKHTIGAARTSKEGGDTRRTIKAKTAHRRSGRVREGNKNAHIRRKLFNVVRRREEAATECR